MDLLSSLGEDERAVLSVLKGKCSLEELSKATGKSQVVAMRALQWLSNKELVKLEKSTERCVELGENGKRYFKSGLPERVFLETLKGGKKLAADIPLEQEELRISIGALKKLAAIEILKPLAFKLTPQGEKLLKKETLEEVFLKTLSIVEESYSLTGIKKIVTSFCFNKCSIAMFTYDG